MARLIVGRSRPWRWWTHRRRGGRRAQPALFSRNTRIYSARSPHRGPDGGGAIGYGAVALHFPRRNHIGDFCRSGITGRSPHAWPNGLIRQGAHPAEGLDDILINRPDHPNHQGRARSPLFARPDPDGLAEPAEPFEESNLSHKDMARAYAKTLASLNPAPTAVDDLMRRWQFSAPVVMAALLKLEIVGRMEMLVGNPVARLD